MKHDAALDRMADTLIRESDARAFGTSNYDALMEKWSDAARAAAVAARRAKAKGGDWRKAARKEYASGAGWRAEQANRSAGEFEDSARRAEQDKGKASWSNVYDRHEQKGDTRKSGFFSSSGQFSSDAAKQRYADTQRAAAGRERAEAGVWSKARSRAIAKQRKATTGKKVAAERSKKAWAKQGAERLRRGAPIPGLRAMR